MNLPEHGHCVHYATVDEDWLDYNDHMNVAYYLKSFDAASESLIAVAGMGESYTRTTHNSWVALESHIIFQQEARIGEELRIESRVIALDDKKIHLYQEMYRDDELLATHEQLGLHFNTATRRAGPFEPAVRANLERMVAAQRQLPAPAVLGRAIGLTRPKRGG